MPETATSRLSQVHALLAAQRYSVTEIGDDALSIQEIDSGVSLRAVLQGGILFLSLVCKVVPRSAITPAIMRKMLDAGNGISTSYFQLYETNAGEVAVTLNNFCKLQDLGSDDEDDILSCVSFLLADVVHAKELIGEDLKAAKAS